MPVLKLLVDVLMELTPAPTTVVSRESIPMAKRSICFTSEKKIILTHHTRPSNNDVWDGEQIILKEFKVE
jgi:hypothetical protein